MKLKFLNNLFLFLLAIVITKWIILFLLPSSSTPQTTSQRKIEKRESKEIELSFDYKDIQNSVEIEYNMAKQDIELFINKELLKQKQRSYYNLSKKEDSFLEWIFGYWNGWQIVIKKTKGLFGSDDNEIKFITENFQKIVISPGLNETYKQIEIYTKKRIEEYYKNVIIITQDYINKKIKLLKIKGYKDINIDTSSIPWGQYITHRAGDVIVFTEATGLTTISLTIGKIVGTKIASIIGPKMIGLVEAKTASIIAGKIASGFELFLAPIVDYFTNEAVKKINYKKTEKEFQDITDKIYYEIEIELKESAINSLNRVKNSIYTELNKKTTIKAKETE